MRQSRLEHTWRSRAAIDSAENVHWTETGTTFCVGAERMAIGRRAGGYECGNLPATETHTHTHLEDVGVVAVPLIKLARQLVASNGNRMEEGCALRVEEEATHGSEEKKTR